MLAFGHLAMALVFLGIALRPLPLRQLCTLKQPVLSLALVVLTAALVLVGLFFLFWSIQNGPVSLVSAISGARPAFVFVYALILSRISTVLLEQRLGKETIALRSVAIGMIVGGITIIHL
ncbi:MAG: hypothetical protein DDT26_01367 [Dehalococcoidia bacterium]|nr:hypothetical protein [Chloroflexota bacterium]